MRRRPGGEVVVAPAMSVPLGAQKDDHPAKAIVRILADARSQLGLDIAFISEFTSDKRVFRFVDGRVESGGIEVGSGDAIENSYCGRIVFGEAPNLMANAQLERSVADMPVTKTLRIGAHISVPIVFSDGRIYGTFCCFSQSPDESLTQRHVELIRMMADLVTEHLESEAMVEETRRLAFERVAEVIDQTALQMVFQPIVELSSKRCVGVEALARFGSQHHHTPDLWFAEAWTAGLGMKLEIEAARLAITGAMEDLPAPTFLSINISPETALSDDLIELLRSTDAERVVLELTEHAAVSDYPPLRSALNKIRSFGTRIAIDDVGTGYSGLQHLLELHPDLLKLDLAITQGIQNDPLRYALAEAVSSFGSRSGLAVVAEGIECEDEASVLKELGIRFGQGYHFGRPERLGSAVAGLDRTEADEASA